MADEILARLTTIEQRLLRLEAAVYRPDLMARPTPADSTPTAPAAPPSDPHPARRLRRGQGRCSVLASRESTTVITPPSPVCSVGQAR